MGTRTRKRGDRGRSRTVRRIKRGGGDGGERAGRRSDQEISRAGTPLGANSVCNGTGNRFHGTGNFGS